MLMTEHYRPEFFSRFEAMEQPCSCHACQQSQDNWPRISVTLNNQLRESLDLGCEKAAREALLNPDAYILQMIHVGPEYKAEPDLWLETLNQQCINLAINPSLSCSGSLYAMGVLLSKAQQYKDANNTDPALLVSMGEQLAILADQGMLEDQLALLPRIDEHRQALLRQMGTMRLHLNLQERDRMGMLLKLSELGVLSQAYLTERLDEMIKFDMNGKLFEKREHVPRNWLLYQLYSDIFPGRVYTNYGQAFKALTGKFFQLRMLLSLWLSDHESLSDEAFIALFTAWFRWQQQLGQDVEEGHTSDYTLLCAMSLL